MIKGLAYLSTPYSRAPYGLQVAYENACQISARLLQRGIMVFSPIAHSHGIAIHGQLNPIDHTIWMPANYLMMDVCGSQLVAHMENWQNSVGIAEEIKYFKQADKSIYDLDPATLEITKRQQE